MLRVTVIRRFPETDINGEKTVSFTVISGKTVEICVKIAGLEYNKYILFSLQGRTPRNPLTSPHTCIKPILNAANIGAGNKGVLYPLAGNNIGVG
jgi:hypothetical protein